MLLKNLGVTISLYSVINILKKIRKALQTVISIFFYQCQLIKFIFQLHQLFMCMYINEYMYTGIDSLIHIYLHTNIHINTHVHIKIQIYIYISICI